jgi:hypothetical protein
VLVWVGWPEAEGRHVRAEHVVELCCELLELQVLLLAPPPLLMLLLDLSLKRDWVGGSDEAELPAEST